MHNHPHSQSGSTSRVLRWSLVGTFVFVLVEIVAGVKAHSLALLSDAGHNFTDVLALLLAWIGVYLQAKPADETKNVRVPPGRRALCIRQRTHAGGAFLMDFLRERAAPEPSRSGP